MGIQMKFPESVEYAVDVRFEEDEDSSFNNVDFGLYSDALGGGNDDFWGSYQASHTYVYEYIGTGAAVDFYVYDISAGSGSDNSGTFTVNIYRCG